LILETTLVCDAKDIKIDASFYIKFET